ncbi:hypothetical protein J7T55_010461 [Diaporthe amygdali]|uniref:uncharacterized protein n=1 Tax=Phomopsis amygdali TaxID=1214568 RepID=UPI0022FE56E8|nr:uncharacterized protein J7T55_010461 [Diaporthe amygdali]KAJ0115638.1 hypothetical protein J7T55_010461 [Diaporthe amygdali]
MTGGFEFNSFSKDIHTQPTQDRANCVQSFHELLSGSKLKMAFNIFENKEQTAVFFLLIVFTPICILVTCLRFRASQLTGRKVAVEDWMALGSLLCFLAWAISSAFVLKHLNGRSDFIQLPIDEAKSALKILGLVQLAYSITVIIVNAFQCRPVQRYWDILLTDGWCINVGAFLAGAESINSVIDFSMALLAVLMLRGLQTSARTKLSLSFIFILGAFAGAVGFIKIGLAFNVTIHNQIMMGLWSTVQQACSVICCCAITLKPLFTQNEFFSRLASRFSSRGSKTKASSHKSQECRQGYVDIEVSGGARNSNSTLKPDSLYATQQDSMGYPMRTVKIEQTYEHV